MSNQCDKLESFVDGELPPVDAENFRHHLTRCGACETRMQELLALELLADDVVNGAEAPAPAPRRPAPWRRPWVVAVPVALAAGLAALVFLTRPAQDAEGADLWLARAPTRTLEARLTHPGADTYHPYQVMRGGPARPEPLSLRELARLEGAGDKRGIASAYLVRGDAAQASTFLEGLPASPDQDSDRAALALQKGAPEEALALADRALKEQPRHPQALWNRGLALRALGLTLTAAEAFEQVAALKEPGWSDEAARRAEELRARAREEKQEWEGTWEGCRRMVSGGEPLSEQQAEALPGMTRLCFYDALRVAGSPERVEALMPLAVKLDRRDGGTHLEDAARRARNRRDFEPRRPLAETYVRLTQGALSSDALEDFLSRLRQGLQDDLLLGALVYVRDARRHLAEYQKLALETRDPWFALLAKERQAKADILDGQPRRAQAMLPEALRPCGDDGRPAYRCMTLQRELALAEAGLHHPVEARTQALEALKRARSGREWGAELGLLQELGQTARMRGDLALARAYTEEAIQRSPDNCGYTEMAYTDLATAFHRALDFPAARQQLDRAARCGGAPSMPRLFVLADLSRTPQHRAEDAELIQRGAEGLRASGMLDAGEASLLRHIEGRYFIEQDRRRGQALLRQALAEAQPLLATDTNARKARVYSYTSLLLDAARHGEWEQGLALFAEELSLSATERCTLGVTVDDERTFIVARDATGRPLGWYDTQRRKPLAEAEVTELVPSRIVDALRACPQVEVLARPPVQGRAGLLPPDLAWAYRVGPGQPAPTQASTRRLVVSDVLNPPELRLPELHPWRGRGGDGSDDAPTLLRGTAATPSRVLEAMRDATEVQIHAHGLIDPGMADASLLVLSPEAEGGRFALTTSDLQGQRLQGHPVVVLAACYAAHTSAYVHENFGLPLAFVAAGARAVLAATQEIPDTEASTFFDKVLARVRSGEPAAQVLRDERRAWVQDGGGTWVEQVLLFE